MRSISPVLVAALLAVSLTAQDDATKQMPAEFHAMVAEWKTAKATYRAAKAEVRDTEAYKAARAVRDIAKMRELTDAVTPPNGKAFGERALALADKCPGDDCLSVLTFAATSLDDADTAKLVIERVLRDHLESAGIAELLSKTRSLGRLISAEETKTLLSEVVAKNPHPLPRALALLAIARGTLRDRSATAADFDRARAQVVEADELAKDSPLAARIRRVRFEVENLLPGCEAPEIKGEDLDGNAFNLSDYRGKVVLLDFWGFW